jgi:hypothetical protein
VSLFPEQESKNSAMNSDKPQIAFFIFLSSYGFTVHVHDKSNFTMAYLACQAKNSQKVKKPGGFFVWGFILFETTTMDRRLRPLPGP